MQWEDFVCWTDRTALYPEAGTGSTAELTYIALGLAGEMGEMLQTDPGSVKHRFELGDVFWYLARGERVLPYPGGLGVKQEDADIASTLLVCNTTKKLLRDGRTDKLITELSCLYQEAQEACVSLLEESFPGLLLEELLDDVVDKLERRKTEGKLHGSGSER